MLTAQVWYLSADSLNKTRAWTVGIGEATAFVGTIGGLQYAWYNEYQSGGFHFFNDWDGWMQMDKAGHSVTAYQAGWNLYKINRWAGISERKSIWYAAGLSYSFQLAVEVMDGFSEGWGFSNYDLLFNTIGSGTFVGQQLGWKEQRIKMKFSFWPSGLSDLPVPLGRRARNLYGESVYEQWLKDYNGQTYWLSANIWSLIGKPNSFPKWLCFSAGYSTNHVLGAESNSWTFPDDPALYTYTRARERQLLFSLDVDLDHVALPAYLGWVRHVVGVIKFPFPTLEWNSQTGWGAHPIYF